MKITQVTPGIISIPPNGWGAIEKVVWNYKLNFENMGHECVISYLDDIDLKSDIIHIHVANLAIEAQKRGIPYVFSLHDHHVFRFGKESELYKQNLEAIKGSIISFTHAEFLVDYFDDTDKLFYLSHGVDTKFFSKKNIIPNEHRLLCVANNGYSDDNSYDRKGFKYAVEAAIKLDLPITIVGPENNMNFFNKNTNLLKYEKLNIINKNVTEEQLLKIYKSHTIFLHPSELEAGQPNLTLLEAASCLLPTVGCYQGQRDIVSLVNCERSTESVVNGIKTVIENYSHYVDGAERFDRLNYSWSVIAKRLERIYKTAISIKSECTSDQARDKYLKAYSNTNLLAFPKKQIKEKININTSFISGAKVEINSNSNKTFLVEFWNKDILVYSTEIKSNEWCAPNLKYFVNWNIKVYLQNNMIFQSEFSVESERVYIAFDSESLGDNVAWIPYVEEFRKKNNCKVIVSTFWNHLFETEYPEIDFVKPGSVVNNLYAMYKIGCFYDSNLEPELCNTIPLQKIASNILGLDHKEIRPMVDHGSDINYWPVSLTKPYVVIAPHSTAGLKYWNNPTGWQEVVDHLIDSGYRVFNVSREGCNFRGVENLKTYSMVEIMNHIKGSEFFIGLSSGLSWLAWAMNKKVVLISNFTNREHEFSEDCIRIVNENVCNSCWINPNFKFDKGDWNWCPIHKDTNRQFECSKTITGKMVISELKTYLK